MKTPETISGLMSGAEVYAEAMDELAGDSEAKDRIWRQQVWMSGVQTHQVPSKAERAVDEAWERNR